ncbi:MAG TPA: hypothetical protein VG713_05490 [Pirellulales bacterium]|nr:hypothetical protein [Pirellulales bacterium]
MSRRPAIRTTRLGMAVMIVLLLLSITLSLSYAVVRSQASASLMQSNSNLDLLARQAAMTGMQTAMRKMSETNWAGVTSSVTGALSGNQSFRVTFQTGDASLSTTGPNASDWSYRVTVVSLGIATDPARPTIASNYTVQAVMKLIPRQLSTNPATFTTALGYTVYQTGTDDFQLELPCRITGAVRVQGNFYLADSYPPSSYGLSRYLSDINAMRGNGYPDDRPLNGPVSIPNSRITGMTKNLLNNSLGVSNISIGSTSATDWSYPSGLTSYQLYPGGQTYSAAIVPSSLANTTLAPDPRTNPLGIFYRSGSLTLGNNVSISGTLVVGGDLVISGSGIALQASSLPALMGSTTPVMLPTIIAAGNVKISSGANVAISGLVATWGALNALQGTQNTALNLQGRVICNGLQFDDRTEWGLSSFLWSLYWSLFNSQSNVPYYPVWLNAFGLWYTPALTVAPETSSVSYLFKDASNKVYVPSSSDPGLAWTVLSWTEIF